MDLGEFLDFYDEIDEFCYLHQCIWFNIMMRGDNDVYCSIFVFFFNPLCF